MSERFAGLKKIPKEPALRQLALANMRLDTALSAPASAPVDQVLAELEAADAWLDMLRLLAAALPPRERVWWGCLAAEDTLADPKAPPAPLAAAQAWVFKPGDETRDRARAALELAEFDDTTTLCATAVAMCDGKLGTGDLAAYDAPVGAAAMAIFGVALLSLSTAEGDSFDAHKTRLIDRALDIARGGNGRLGGDNAAVKEGEPS
ncbi:hypothetical protein DKT77_18650 [Meridianimarinicoccus roseus]|uniref:Uncharacterized protein n=1 Tax=Meridianimarinicoccus roseus TaxID=2072018 RepID=A0A2V2L6W5_9RHOB|nr:hypothetical protein [Meridianimarinicoccus roseus]PWR01178.1 hypothetical protein DKT77_18650 [Meridianimarinicoccus roseus]